MAVEISVICDRCKRNFGSDPYPPLNKILIQVNADECVETLEEREICQPCFDGTWALVETYLKDTNGEEVTWEVGNNG